MSQSDGPFGRGTWPLEGTPGRDFPADTTSLLREYPRTNQFTEPVSGVPVGGRGWCSPTWVRIESPKPVSARKIAIGRESPSVDPFAEDPEHHEHDRVGFEDVERPRPWIGGGTRRLQPLGRGNGRDVPLRQRDRTDMKVDDRGDPTFPTVPSSTAHGNESRFAPSAVWNDPAAPPASGDIDCDTSGRGRGCSRRGSFGDG